MRSYFYFNGARSIDKGLTIEKCPSISTGQRVVSKKSIPGRSGDLVIDTGAYGNCTQAYEVWFMDKRRGTARAARDIAHWLLSGTGYLRLEDTYDPEVFRLALFAGPIDVENWMLMAGRATLEFDCQPQRWLKSGQNPIAVQSGQSLFNAWQPALPLIQVTGTGDGSLTVGGSTFTISDMPGGIMLDSETQDAYWGDPYTNLNNNVKVSGGYPVLQAGETAVSFSGDITAVQITPRWWSL